MNNEMITTRDRRGAEGSVARVRRLTPACDVYENGEEYLVMAEMPGVDQEAIDLRLDRGRLHMAALRSAGRDGDEPALDARYERIFEVPDAIDGERIQASLDNGVLSVHLPKAARARMRKIAVTGA